MRHEFVEQNAGTVSVAQAAVGGLNAVSTQLDACFLPVGEALLVLVETVDSVVRGLAEVRSAFADSTTDQAIDELARAAVCLLDTPALQARRRDCFADLRTRVGTLNVLSADLDRVLHMLQFYSLNVKIAAGGAAEFVDFADEMRKQLGEGRTQLAHFGTTVGHLVRELDTMLTIDKQLSGECDKLIPSVPDRLAAAAESLRHQRKRVADVVAAGETTARKIKARIAEALGAIQIGDSARQRIEHVAFACEQFEQAATLADPVRHEVESRLAALCVAQLEAIGSDFTGEARTLLGSLEKLLPDTRHLLNSIRNEDSITESAALVETLGGGIADCATLTGHLQQANAEVAAILGSVVSTITDLSNRVEHVRDLGIEVGYMSVNANLRCRREQAISQPVSVIAREIKAHSRIIDELSCAFVDVSDDLRGVSGRMSDAGMSDSFDVEAALTSSHDALHQAALRSQHGVQQVGLDCDGLVERLVVTIDNLQESLGIMARLDAIRHDLAPLAMRFRPGALADPDHPLHPILHRIHARYTMAQERAVHARLTPDGALPGPKTGEIVNDDTDDGLF